MQQLFISLIAEGTTDIRFLKNVIFKSIQDLSWRCNNQIEIFDITEITAEGDSFVDKMIAAAKHAYQSGTSILCIHADSDARTVNEVMQYKFEPFLSALEDLPNDGYCKLIIPTIPIQMIESWMLADKLLLKQLINAKHLSDAVLEIEKAPEYYSDPKSTIENAIRKSMENEPRKKRNQIHIADLYEIVGNKLTLEKLRTIPSFLKFEEYIISAFKEMGLLY